MPSELLDLGHEAPIFFALLLVDWRRLSQHQHAINIGYNSWYAIIRRAFGDCRLTRLAFRLLFLLFLNAFGQFLLGLSDLLVVFLGLMSCHRV